ncbi:MAG: hypothetical protein GX139_11375, partial [Armatimonadetes bacterium]|nr:hypothetical protein [Armatimonadota bacterium]
MPNPGKRSIAAIALVFAVSLQVCAVAAKKPVPLSSKLGSVNKKIKQVQHRIRLNENQKKTVLGQLSVVEAKLDDAQHRLNS